jgi:queuosine precursor transporter
MDSPSSTLTISRFSVKDWLHSVARGILIVEPLPVDTIKHGTMRAAARRYKYLDALTTAFVVILLVSNLIAQKVCLIGPVSVGRLSIGPFAVSGAILLFPITYIFGDVFTEVYGYAASRRAIWLGFFGTALLYVIASIVIALPSAPGWQNQEAFSTVFGFIPRILAASLISFWAGEFANSYTMARMKLVTNGRMLWTRTIGSTVVGQAVDTTLVIILTFGGIYSVRTLLNIIVTGYALKVGYEVAATPVTYLVINWLKRTEHSDAFDRHQSFNPFSFADKGVPEA